MRYGFVTCVELGLGCIEEILAIGGHLELLVTLEDHRATAKSGRVFLDAVAAEHGIPLVKIRHINDPGTVEAIRAADLDWLFIIGWSQIAGPEILHSTRNGVLGMHPTLLPEGRGRAAIPWAILKGLDRTGVTMFVLDEGVDTGPVVAQVVVPIGERETATALYERVDAAHRELMRSAWASLEDGTCEPRPQDDSLATHWPGRTPEDGRITPDMSVDEVDRLVRATTHPYPGAFVDLPVGRLRIWAGAPAKPSSSDQTIACKNGAYAATQAVLEQT